MATTNPRTTALAEDEVTVRVSSVDTTAADVVSLTLEAAEQGPLPPWTPGAHIDILLGNGMVRQYSLCGDPNDTHQWRIAVLREVGGRGGSLFLHEQIRPGDVLDIRGPRNNFPLVPAEKYLFIAGGIGITPLIPMVKVADAEGVAWTLLYGGRTSTSMAFTEELADIPGGTVRLWPEDQYGLLDLNSVLGEPDSQTAVYCCGPGPLIDAVEGHCARWPAGSLHRERFAPKSLLPARPDGGFEVELARSGKRLTVRPDEPLLDVLEEAGYPVISSCRAGICGTCLLGVLDGLPEHRDDVLSDEERDSDAMILPCVSRSRSEVLVLDL